MKIPFLSRRDPSPPAPLPQGERGGAPAALSPSQTPADLVAEEGRTGMHGPSPVESGEAFAAALDTARPELSQEIARPELIGVRAFWAESVAPGLTPERMATVLKSAIRGDHRPFLELAEEMEERDLHYFSVLGTRKRALSRLRAQVDPATEAADDGKVADAVRDLLREPKFRHMLREMTDAFGKGYSVVEIVWGEKDGMFWPTAYLRRDQKYFTFDYISRTEVRAQVLATIDGEALPPAKFLCHRPLLKSGIPIRGGFAWLAAWAFCFKSFSLRDWMTFLDVYGMPIRVGKYHPAATAEERRKLLTAVSSIATDAAAIIPESMAIEFIEAKANTDAPFERMGRYMDEQMSKAIVGQTMTTESGGSLAQAKIHNQVRIDLLEDDSDQLAATVNLQLVRWFVAFNFGANVTAPYAVFPVAEPEDVAALTNALASLVPLGLKVSMREVRERVGFGEPDEDEELLTAPAAATVPKPQTAGQIDKAWMSRANGEWRAANGGLARALNASGVDPMDEVEAIGETGAEDWEATMSPIVERILAAAERATSFESFSAAITAMAGEIETDVLAKRLATAMLKARALGMLGGQP